jgi:hypothetical protein
MVQPAGQKDPTMAELLEQWRTAERATEAAERLAAAAERAASAAERAALAAEKTADAALATLKVAEESSKAARESAADARGASGTAVSEALTMREDVGRAQGEADAAHQRYRDAADMKRDGSG